MGKLKSLADFLTSYHFLLYNVLKDMIHETGLPSVISQKLPTFPLKTLHCGHNPIIFQKPVTNPG